MFIFSGCGGDFTGENGLIKSPNYPMSFPVFSDCVWRVKAPVGRYISLRFQEFTGINGTNSECSVDSIELREGYSSRAQLIGISRNSHLLLQFHILNHIILNNTFYCYKKRYSSDRISQMMTF